MHLLFYIAVRSVTIGPYIFQYTQVLKIRQRYKSRFLSSVDQSGGGSGQSKTSDDRLEGWGKGGNWLNIEFELDSGRI